MVIDSVSDMIKSVEMGRRKEIEEWKRDATRLFKPNKSLMI